MSRRILVVDDEESILQSLEGVLHDEGYEVVRASSGEEALEKVEAEDPDLVLLDVWLPGKDGIETLEILRGGFRSLPVLMMSGHGSIETAVKATRLGAYDFIEKPLNLDKVLLAIDNAFRVGRLAEENRFWRETAARGVPMLGDSPALVALRERVRAVAPTRAPVLITGEKGTGKELLARAIHRHSERCDGPFVRVHCVAIPDEIVESELFGHEKGAFTGAAARRRGRFDLADGGTLFLTRIGDRSLKTQAKILRVLQEGRFERVGGSRTHQVDARVIVATDRDLEEEIRQGHFREDLYVRLSGISFHVPPLRDRKRDIPLLAEHFIRRCCAEEGRDPVEVHPEALALLEAHDWPGNVRELKSVTESMVLRSGGGELRALDLLDVLRPPP